MDDLTLRTRFEDLSLPFERWSHQAHVRIAWIYLEALPFPEALATVRRRIQAYNAHNDVPEGPLQGYNETTTHALLHLIDVVRRGYRELLPCEDSRAFYEGHPQFHTSKILRCFYSAARHRDARAKRVFLEPDLTPLPRLPA